MMRPIAIVRSASAGTASVEMFVRAAEFWGLPFDQVGAQALAGDRYGVAVVASDQAWSEGEAARVRQFHEAGGRLLVAGALPSGLTDVRVEQQEAMAARCVRITAVGVGRWRNGEVLPFTAAADAAARDQWTVAQWDDAQFDILGRSHVLTAAGSGALDGSPALLASRGDGPAVIYTPVPIGAMSHVAQPEIPTFHEYPYVVENHALLVLIRDLLELAHRDCDFSPRPLWPDGARAAVCVTGDVHDYTGIGLPDRADREYRDMIAYMDILKEEGLEGRASLFVSGAVAAAHPPEVRSAIERGYEVGPHTYKDRSYSSLGLGFDEQKDDVERSIAAFRSVWPGHVDSARSFRTHGYNSNGTTRAVLDGLGYDHICDLQGWDPDDVGGDASGSTARYLSLPQAARGPRGEMLRLLEAPDTVANDHFVYRVYKMSPAHALDYYKRQFDRIYRLGGLFLVCWHPYIALSEAPGRDETFRAALRYMADHSGVAMMQVKELTSWWRHRLDPQGRAAE